MWVVWWFSNMAIISLPQYLLEWRLKHYKTQEETIVEQTEKELSLIREEIKKEDKQQEECKKRNTYAYNNDLPF